MTDATTVIAVTLDWTQIINTFIGTLPLMITAAAGLLSVMRQIGVIHVATNSMKDALVASTAKASLAQGMAAGVAQGKMEEQARSAQGPPSAGFKAEMRSWFLDPW